MPPKSKAQARLMWAARHSPKVRRKTGISPTVAEEFTETMDAGDVKNLPERSTRKRRKGKR